MQCRNRLATSRIALTLPFAVLGPGIALAQGACEAETASLVTLARGFVDLEVLWEDTLELCRDAAAHEANAVHCIDQRFCVRLEDVALCKKDHGGAP